MIEFLCPNGHQIHCPDEQAGRAAKCPRCGVKFRVPQLPEIEFLCPNGHRLHGPASQQGRPGECPECGCKFRVPTFDELPEEEEMLSEASLGGVDSSTAPSAQETHSPQEPPSPRIEEIGEIEELSVPVAVTTLAVESKGAESEAVAPAHPLAATLSRLWAEKPSDGVVELHFPNGETVVADRFAEAMSQRQHGVFAVKERDGTYTLTVVAWDSVQRILVRGLDTLPGGIVWQPAD